MLGWYQEEYGVSMGLITLCDGKRIIDVGAGATTLIDSLVENEYDVTVLGYSKALQILSDRHGENLKYIHGDLSKSLDLGEYDIWHDRYSTSFFVNKIDREKYITNIESVLSGGFAVIETFSTDGAKMCCGLDLYTYDEEILADLFGENWLLVDSIRHTHINPFDGERPYISAILQRK